MSLLTFILKELNSKNLSPILFVCIITLSVDKSLKKNSLGLPVGAKVNISKQDKTVSDASFMVV